MKPWLVALAVFGLFWLPTVIALIQAVLSYRVGRSG